MEISLSSIFEGKDLLAAKACSDPEELFITDSTGLYLYKVFERQSVWSKSSSWKPKDSNFTTPFLYHSGQKLCIGPRKKQILSFFASDPNNPKMIPIPREVYQMDLLSSIDLLCTIFVDGLIHFYDISLRSLGGNNWIPTNMKNIFIRYAKIFSMADGKGYSLVIVVQETDEFSQLSWVNFTFKKEESNSFEIKFVASGTVPTTLTNNTFNLVDIFLDPNTKEISNLWSNGLLESFKFALNQLNGEQKEISPQTLAIHTIKIYDFKTVRMIGGYKDSILILCGINTNLTKYQLTFWSVTYGTLQGSFVLEEIPPTDKLLQLTYSYDKSYIVVVFSHYVVTLACYIPGNSLLSVLGKMKITEEVTQFNTNLPMIPITIPLNSFIPQNEEGQVLDSFVPSEKDWEKFFSTTETKILEQFNQPNLDNETLLKLWQEFHTSLSTQQDESESKNKKTKKKKISKTQFSPQFSITIAKICLEKPMPFWEPIKGLISASSLSFQNVPSLLPLLIKHQNHQLLSLCLREFSDISARDMTRIIKYALQLPLNAGKNDGAEHFMCLVLSSPISHSLMAQYIRTFSSVEIEKLFDVMLHLMKLLTTGNEDKLPYKTLFNGLISFFELLLDAHFTTLILLKSCHPKLQELKQLTEKALEFCESCEKIYGLLRTLKEKRPLPPKHEDNSYSIEFHPL